MNDTVLTLNVISHFECDIGIVQWFTDLRAIAVLASGIVITVSRFTTFTLLTRQSGGPRGTVNVAPHSVT